VMVGSRMTPTSRHVGRNLLELLQPFPAEAVFVDCKTSGIAAGPRQVRDEAGPDRIRGLREHDRHRAGRLQQWRHDRAARGQNDVRRERDQFLRAYRRMRSASPTAQR
jgi:hypothetical protein